jgi:lipoyl(octanoyl) transferase
LILCEHSALLTVGRQGSRAHIGCDFSELAARRWGVRWVNRGGGCILHLPGQLCIYSIVPIEPTAAAITGYMARLHHVIGRVLEDFEIAGRWNESRLGVWVGDRLIATVGVAVRNWVTYYGAVLNVNPDLDLFRRFRVGRREDGVMTSIERERRGRVRPSLVRERLIDRFASEFHFARTSLFHDDPAIHRKATTDAIPTCR